MLCVVYKCIHAYVYTCVGVCSHIHIGDLRLASGIVLKWTPLGDSEQFLSSASPGSQLGIYGMSLSRAMIMSASASTHTDDKILTPVETQNCEPVPPCLKVRELEFILLSQS